MRMRIFLTMNPLLHIRKNVLRTTQADLATIAGTRQGTVSRWETGELLPDLDQMSRIRDAAKDRGVDWDDSLFFATPEQVGAA